MKQDEEDTPKFYNRFSNLLDLNNENLISRPPPPRPTPPRLKSVSFLTGQLEVEPTLLLCALFFSIKMTLLFCSVHFPVKPLSFPGLPSS